MFTQFKFGWRKFSPIFGVISLSLAMPLVINQGAATARPLSIGDRHFSPSWSQITDQLGLPRINFPQNPQPIPTQTSIPPQQEETVPIPQVEVETETANIPRFRCEVVNGQYTVMYYPVSQPTQGFPWAVPGEMGGGWTPQRRCQEISSRLESYRPDGLVALQTAVENGHNTVCATTEDIPQCRIVLTVPAGESAEVVRDRIFQNLLIADSGQSTQGVVTLVNERSTLGTLEGIIPRSSSNRSQGILLKPFLDPADGGTGNRLNRRFFR
ncbi:COP23 domain-containing protein [Arthrospira platensis]|uniref:COP23 domain-containing protein n=2 Tax=Sirenicapillariaceae TaxID=2934961 RepID=UPI0001C39183|nr:COP23 domain-containing protein [Arthrospira platensis]KDR57021.1 hypothetical protein APPUASWS_013480 [Arthrospira platensis str. Paraca]MBD2668946.1 hypothetical protein [Arthrospira platensis FACHB-439]MBD2709382.1 hypothetical protein [Arthrospira platensis FACHB-835]MDT9310994.1 COP23 domain-containing protein [Limnospira sp. Paracas R14]QQW29246.1 COP23 domain-containing protein [Arthrospira sp. PCC 9108]